MTWKTTDRLTVRLRKIKDLCSDEAKEKKNLNKTVGMTSWVDETINHPWSILAKNARAFDKGNIWE